MHLHSKNPFLDLSPDEKQKFTWRMVVALN